MDVRGEETSFAGQNGDVNVGSFGDLVHGARQLVIEASIEGVEFLGHVERDCGDFALIVDEDAGICHCVLFLGDEAGLAKL